MAASIFQLTMRSGPTPGKTFPLEEQEMLLGRDLANDISISDPEVSRRHARFLMQEDNVIIEDLGSTNGTFLNGQRIASPQQLRVGDVITLGENIVMVFDKVNFDPDATVVSTGIDQTVQPVPKAEAPIPHPSHGIIPPQPTPQPAVQQMPVQESPAEEVEQLRAKMKPSEKKKMPAWLIVLIVAIVVIACVIAVTLYFMPASWWCAITFNMLEGCPIP